MASLVSGAAGYVSFVVDGAYVFEAATNHMFCLPLSLLTNDILWSNLSSASSFAVYDMSGGGLRPKYCIVDVAGRLGVLYWDGVLAASREYRIYFGKKVSALNSVLAATNSGYQSFSPLCEATGTDIFNFGGINGALVAPGTINNAGSIYKAYNGTGAAGVGSVRTDTDLLGVGGITISCIVYANGYGNNNAGRVVDGGSTAINIASVNTRFRITSNAHLTLAYSAAGSAPLGQYIHLVVSRSSAGLANFYVNGALSGTANQNSGTPAPGNPVVYYGNNSASTVAFNGKIEQIGIKNTTCTLDYARTQKAMMITPNLFYGGAYTLATISSRDKKFRYGFGFGF
jgi:hypothetical protein